MKRTGLLIIIAMLALFLSFRQVKGQSAAEQARNAIANIDDQIRAGTDNLHSYWNNITDSTRFEALSDIQKAWNEYGFARVMFDAGLYNDSLQEAYGAIFLSDRATYRIFLDMAQDHIARANSTMKSIPTYIAQSTEAEKKLKQACELYNGCYLTDVFGDYLPTVEMSQQWINGMYHAENDLYWTSDSNVIKITDEALSDVIASAKSEEESLQPTISNEIDGVSSTFYFQLIVTCIVDLCFFVVFLAPILRRTKGWWQKANYRIIWDGNLWGRKLNVGSVGGTLGAMATVTGFLYQWTDSTFGLARTYNVSIPTGLFAIIDVLLRVLTFLIGALVVLFGVNRFKWQRFTGLSFFTLLVLGNALCATMIALGCISMGQIHYVALYN